jgi:dihydroorotate dehydrogenase
MRRAEAAIRQKWDLYEVMATAGEHPPWWSEAMVDLATTYMGLRLKHPVIASPGPISKSLGGIRELEDAGAAALVLFSLFEEQIRRENAATEHLIGVGAESFAEALDYFPAVEGHEVGPEPYLELIRRARETTDIPIIASLNGATREGWADYARRMEQAGASASSSTSTISRPTSRPQGARLSSSISMCCAR